MCCHNGYCGKCRAYMSVVWGALILLNAYVWPMWMGVDGWIKFLGVLFVLHGLIHVAKPTCGCEVEMSAKGKKR